MLKKRVTCAAIACIMALTVSLAAPVSQAAESAAHAKTYVYAEKMMDDFLAVYLRDHQNQQGDTVGKSTWRWSNNPSQPGGGLTNETRRETDFWLSALIYDTVNDAYEYSKNPKYVTLMNDLYTSFVSARYHPTWDVHVWQDNTYNDDLCWWSQAFLRTYTLTGDRKYFDLATELFDTLYLGWDETPAFGGAPYGGVLWRRSAGGVVVPVANNEKNVATNGNASLIASRLSMAYATINPAKSADYAAKAKKIYDWAFAHLYKGAGRMIDNIRYNGNESATQFTYNYGLFAGAGYELYTVTGDSRYLDTAKEVLRYGWNTLTLSDRLTIKDEGQGDTAGFKMVFLRMTAAMVNQGGLTEFEDYLVANACQAWKNRRAADGLCGANLAMRPKADAGIASPCAALGPALLFYTGFDAMGQYDYDLLDLTDGVGGVYQAESAFNEYVQFDSSQSGHTGTGYTQYWDADGPHLQNGYIRFDVTAPKAGVYKLDFRWYTRGNNTRRLSINDGPVSVLDFTRTAANRWEVLSYYAYLNAGANTVKVIYYNKSSNPVGMRDLDSWLFLDSLTLDYRSPFAVPPQSVETGGVNFAGDYTEGWLGTAEGQYVDFKVSVPAAGSYALNFFFANNSSEALRELIVNGTPRQQLLAFPKIGPGWSHASTVRLYGVALQAGLNTIRVTNNAAKGTAQYVNLLKYLGVTKIGVTLENESVSRTATALHVTSLIANDQGIEQQLVAILALYDRQGALVKLQVQPLTLAAGERKAVVSTLGDLLPSGDYAARVMVWDLSFRPLTDGCDVDMT